MDKIKYIECGCHDFDDVTRVCYISNDESLLQGTFYFEYRVSKYPGTLSSMPYRTIYDKIKFRFVVIKTYFRNIWWSIKGRPVWFTGQAEIRSDQANELIKFMKECLSEKSKDKN